MKKKIILDRLKEKNKLLNKEKEIEIIENNKISNKKIMRKTLYLNTSLNLKEHIQYLYNLMSSICDIMPQKIWPVKYGFLISV